MEKTVQLPSGNSAVFRDPNELRVKDRTKVLEGIGNAESQISQGLKLIDGIIALLVKEWSFDLIIPNVSINSLQSYLFLITMLLARLLKMLARCYSHQSLRIKTTAQKTIRAA